MGKRAVDALITALLLCLLQQNADSRPRPEEILLFALYWTQTDVGELQENFTAADLLCLLRDECDFRGPIPCDVPVEIPDFFLEQDIREALDRPEGPICRSHMATLTNLIVGSLQYGPGVTECPGNVANLEGLQYAVNLQTLTIGCNVVSDLSPLSGLTNLREILIYQNAISDLSPLAQLPNLEVLDISILNAGSVSDLSPLSGLTRLRVLRLADNSVSDLTPLAGLVNLEELELTRNQVVDLSPLAGLTNLVRLSLAGAPSNKSKTETAGFSVQKNGVTDVSPLAGLTKLQSLDLSSNRISDIEALGSLTRLEILALDDNEISDIGSLENLTNLKTLLLSTNRISSITAVAGLNRLEELRLNRNRIADLSPLAGLSRLEVLSLSENQVTDLTPLSGLTKLSSLALNRNRISDLSPVFNLPLLTRLEADYNNLSRIQPVPGHSGIRTLYLSGNRITDLGGLSSLVFLRSLSVSLNPISDLLPLQNLFNLEFISMQDTNVSDLQPLVSNPGLSYPGRVFLEGAPLSEEAECNQVPVLLERGVDVKYDASRTCTPIAFPTSTPTPTPAVLPDYPLEWAFAPGGPGRSSGLVIDGISGEGGSDTGFVVIGDFSESITFGDDPGETLSAEEGEHFFLARYDPDASLQWVCQAEGKPVDMVAFPDGSTVILGEFHASAVLGRGQVDQTTLTSPDRDLFLAEYDPVGNLKWARQTQGDRNTLAAGAVTGTTSGGILVAGNWWSGSIVFGAGEPGETTLQSGPDEFGSFLAAYDGEGTFRWVAQVEGNLSGLSLSVIGEEGVLAGSFYDRVVFNPGTTEERILVADADGDGFLARFDDRGNFLWVQSIGGREPNSVEDVRMLADGSSIVTGSYAGAAFFGVGEAGQTLLFSEGREDLFLARYGPNGNLVWVRHIPCSGQVVPQALDVTGAGTIFMTGFFSESATFGPGEPTEIYLTSAGDWDAFIALFTTDGDFIAARRAGGTENERPRDLTATEDGAAYMTGYFLSDAAVFGPGEMNETILEVHGFSDAFVARYAPFGFPLPTHTPTTTREPVLPTLTPTPTVETHPLLWARRAGGLDRDRATAVVSDPTGGCVVVGRIKKEAVFGPGEANETRIDTSGPFIARYARGGALDWVRHPEGNGFADRAEDVGCLPDDGVVVVGRFAREIVFASGEVEATTLSSHGINDRDDDIFVAEYGLDGTFRWAKRAGGASDDEAKAVAVFPDGRFVVTGSFATSAVFNPGEEDETLVESSGRTAFVAKYDTGGRLNWVGVLGSGYELMVTDVAPVSDGGCYVSGYFSGSAVFAPGEPLETELNAVEDEDLFLARVDPDGSLAWVIQGGGLDSDEALAVTANASDEAILTGMFQTFLTFEEGEPNETTLERSEGSSRLFLAKYGADGSFGWARSPELPENAQKGKTIAVLPNGDLLVAGDGSDPFLGRFSPNGELGWSRPVGRYEGFLFGLSPVGDLAFSREGEVTLVGVFENNVVFGRGEPGETTLHSSGDEDIFIARYDSFGTLVPAETPISKSFLSRRR